MLEKFTEVMDKEGQILVKVLKENVKESHNNKLDVAPFVDNCTLDTITGEINFTNKLCFRFGINKTYAKQIYWAQVTWRATLWITFILIVYAIKTLMGNYCCQEFFMSLSNRVELFNIQARFWIPRSGFSNLVIWQEIFKITICTTYQKFKKGFFFVFESFLKICKKCRFDPCWRPLRVTGSNFYKAVYFCMRKIALAIRLQNFKLMRLVISKILAINSMVTHAHTHTRT